MSIISESDITYRDEDETSTQNYKRYKDLFSDFMATRDVLCSDGDKFINRHMNTKTGTLLDRDDLLKEMKQVEERREAERAAREQRDE